MSEATSRSHLIPEICQKLGPYCTAASHGCESLESRILLSGWPDAELLNRLVMHTATPQDLVAHELAEVRINGAAAYAKAGEWIVEFNLNSSRPTAQVAVAQLGFGARLKKTLGKPELALIELPRDINYAQVQARLVRLRLGAYIEPNILVGPAATFPEDPFFGALWGLHNVQQTGGTLDADVDAPEAWDRTTGTSNVAIAVFDGGVDYTHPDLAANMWTNPGEIPGNGIDDDENGYIDDYYGYDFVGNDSVLDPNVHGTHVAGILGAVGNNNVGVTGVNWNADIMSCQIFGTNVIGFAAAVVNGLNYVRMMKTRPTNPVNVRVTNHSWAVYPDDTGVTPILQSLYSAIQSHQQDDILFVAAAGNRARNNDLVGTAGFPASFDLDNIISVANTDHNDELFFESNYGATTVDLAAPGTDILSTIPFQLDVKDGIQDGYTLLTGTSMSSPHVAGVAGLAFSLPGMANAPYQLVKGAILSGADSIGHIGNNSQKPTVTNGRLSAYNTLNILLQQPVVQTGTAGDDTIIARVHPSDSTQLQVLVNGDQVFLGPKNLVPSLTLNGLGGNDTITLEDSFYFPTTLDGGAGDDTISVLGDGVGGETVVVSGDGAADVLNVDTDDVGLSRVRLNGSETLSALNVGTGGGVLMSTHGDRVLRTQTLSVAAGGFIDLADNPMIVDYDEEPNSPLASIQSLITSGYNNGAWTGNGIRSTVAAGAGNTAIGFAEASEILTFDPNGMGTFAGQQVDTTALLLRYTYYGDADLTGAVTLQDFNRLAANFGLSPRRWVHGDFNFDDMVNLTDFNLLAANFGMSGLGPGGDLQGDEDSITYEELEEMLDD